MKYRIIGNGEYYVVQRCNWLTLGLWFSPRWLGFNTRRVRNHLDSFEEALDGLDRAKDSYQPPKWVVFREDPLPNSPEVKP